MASSKYISLDWILLFSRVVLAMVMIYYGWPKIRDLRSNANDFVQMGFKPGMFWGTLIAGVEFFGGIAILLGYYAELAAALFAFQMMVGMFWKLKIRKAFSDYSYDIQLFALSLTSCFTAQEGMRSKHFPAPYFFVGTSRCPRWRRRCFWLFSASHLPRVHGSWLLHELYDTTDIPVQKAL